ncbi:MAG: hypothetical protein M1833_001342 [Piccolia ochrophora]|nr:MAG: hypothetical protein M1833_001342 [Piccolia ochrophora]
MAESPASPLSSLASDDFTEEVKSEDGDHSIDAIPDHTTDTPTMPPSKRQRRNSAWDARPPYLQAENDTLSDVSSDTSGDVPGSPTNTSQMQDEDAMGHEQVTVCRWDGCAAGEMGNMDTLVAHIHEDHIGTRQKKYSCEWDDCNRKGMPHPSGYALRAHMRSHTREKPFYCALPECDRSFTRSDALAKHMRTVHETEALRPSDPVPKNHPNAPHKFQRIKLILSAKPPDMEQANGEGQEMMVDDDATIVTSTDVDSSGHAISTFDPYPPELEFTEGENAMPGKDLYRLLRRQLQWAEDERQQLQTEVEELEQKKKQEWIEKELLLENVMEAEMAHQKRRSGGTFDESKMTTLPNVSLPMNGEEPWYRKGDTRAQALEVKAVDEVMT